MTMTCAECGFDSARWSDDDLARTIAHTDDLIGHALDGADPALRVAAGAMGPVDVDGDDPVVTAHAVMHRLDDLATLRDAHEPFEPMLGRIESLHASAGGAPKPEIPHAIVDAGGIVGDSQDNRRNHGRPWQALCCYSSDLLEVLRGEGHPIVAGGAGENLTISGVDWGRMRGGLTITIGSGADAVRLRTSSPAAPCHKIGDCFTERSWDRIDHDEHPGWARWYTSVLDGGAIEPGAAVLITG